MEQYSIYEKLGISKEVFEAGERVWRDLGPRFLDFDKRR